MRIDAEFLKKFWVQETPSGTINGSNTAFTLSQTPFENETIMLFLDGLLLKQGTDYTVSGTSITMTTAPALAQEMRVQYIMKTGEN